MKTVIIAVVRFLLGLRGPSKATNQRLLHERGETGMALTIREVTAVDLVALARLHVETWNATYPGVRSKPTYEIRERQWREAFAVTDGTWFCFVIERRDGQLIGFAKETRNDHPEFSGELNKIYLRREYQRLGKEFNRLLLSGITHIEAIDAIGQRAQKPATPGEYKRLPNHVLQPDGAIHRYTEPLHVPAEIEALFKWIQESMAYQHPVIISAVAHYNLARIHPFDDGNGRGARILMNLILIKKHYAPAVIKQEQRRAYLETLSLADGGNLAPFCELVTRSLLNTQKIILQDLMENTK